MIDVDAIRGEFDRLDPFLNERARRLFAANKVMSLGRGGLRAVAEATGLARSTILRGIAELKGGINEIGDRLRAPGAGRPRAETVQPGLMEALKRLVEDATRGDPETPLRWVSRSLSHIVEALRDLGFQVTKNVVSRLLCELGYSLQANRKTNEGTNHPDRNAQFEYINANINAAIDEGQPIISVDTKKKEPIGNFRNNGKELRPECDPEQVEVHDFPDPNLGKVAPYGIYDIQANDGWVNLGTSADTAKFAVESIRRWWNNIGKHRYPDTKRLHITADCGGSNGVRVRLWKLELQRLADELGIKIVVTHYPPGTSKWNKIEHAMFSFISINWRGKPLTSLYVIFMLIAATTTASGLTIDCSVDENIYQTGIKVTDEEMATINIERHSFHGDWNYTISPRTNDEQYR